jgi:hypothetical protein
MPTTRTATAASAPLDAAASSMPDRPICVPSQPQPNEPKASAPL